MKQIILMILLSLLTVSLFGEKITDETWLKAVKLKQESMSVYPTQTQYISETKDKKGEVQQEERIKISHREENGKIINSLVTASNSEGELTAEDESVVRYLSMSVLPEDESVFKSESSPEFNLERVSNEIIEGNNYAKYKITMKSKSGDEKIDSEGFMWLNSDSGAPYRLKLEVDPHKMVVKELIVDTYYSQSDLGFLQTDKVTTDIVISIVFKKIYITQTILRENYQKLSNR